VPERPDAAKTWPRWPRRIVLYDDSLPIAARARCAYYPMPVSKLVKEAGVPFELKDYIANMVYVGVLTYLLDIDMQEIADAVSWNFDGKPKPIELNMSMGAGRTTGQGEPDKERSLRVQRMSGFNEGKILADGNTAAHSDDLRRRHVRWLVPITPASSVVDGLNKYLPKLRTDADTGKANFAVVQAEDELARWHGRGS